MKLILLYGPPGVGKLTVAQKLNKLTGYTIFHNHMTVDLASQIVKFGTKDFWKLNDRLRTTLIEAASKENVNLIITFCFAYPDDSKWINKIKNIVKKHNGKFCPVQLITDEKTLHRRIKGASRKNFDKIKTRKSLDSCLKRWNLFTKIPKINHPSINNTKLSPTKVAEKIVRYYKL